MVVDVPRAKRMLLLPNTGGVLSLFSLWNNSTFAILLKLIFTADLEELVGDEESTAQLSLVTKEVPLRLVLSFIFSFTCQPNEIEPAIASNF